MSEATVGGASIDGRVRWGVLGAAGIALNKVIPAMQRGQMSRVVAIASRDLRKAREAADALGIERAYGSYEELLADPAVEAVYNPLPNHLHVPWSTRAAEAGKHVLCEKPIAMTAEEARALVAVRDRTGVRMGEAFMVRTHPQWLEARRLARSGRIGQLRLVTGHFSYFKLDADNIRSRLEYGGGALMDIGCYPVMLSRWLFGEEPLRVVGLVERDPEMKIDRLTSGMLEFPSGQATFSCATQLTPHQRMELLGTDGRIQIDVPFSPAPDLPGRILLEGRGGGGPERATVEVPAVDQYTLQGDAFSRAVRGLGEVPVPLEDAVRNMAVIDALFRSAESGRWEPPERLV